MSRSQVWDKQLGQWVPLVTPGSDGGQHVLEGDKDNPPVDLADYQLLYDPNEPGPGSSGVSVFTFTATSAIGSTYVELPPLASFGAPLVDGQMYLVQMFVAIRFEVYNNNLASEIRVRGFNGPINGQIVTDFSDYRQNRISNETVLVSGVNVYQWNASLGAPSLAAKVTQGTVQTTTDVNRKASLTFTPIGAS